MNMKTMKISVTAMLVLLLCILLLPTTVLAAKKTGKTKEKLAYTPKVLSKLDEGTTKVQVYVYDHTTLYIRNGSRLVARNRFGKKGSKTVRIPRQKNGSTLSFQLKNNRTGLFGSAVYQKVGGKNTQTAAEASVAYRDGTVYVSGPAGSKVYVKVLKEHRRRWRRVARITGSQELVLLPGKLNGGSWDSFLIRLKLPGGRFTKAEKIDMPRDNGPSVTL